MTPCAPSLPTYRCGTCARFNPGVHADPLLRHGIVIDATVVRRPDEPCPLFERALVTLDAWMRVKAS